MSRLPPPVPEMGEEEARLFRRWQRRQDDRDVLDRKRTNRLAIENGDPECEAVIAALEEGWREGR